MASNSEARKRTEERQAERTHRAAKAWAAEELGDAYWNCPNKIEPPDPDLPPPFYDYLHSPDGHDVTITWRHPTRQAAQQHLNQLHTNRDNTDQTPTTVRRQLLEEAADLIDGDRNRDYGPPSEDFQRTAGILNALGYRHWSPNPTGSQLLQPHHIAIAMIAVKLSRLTQSPHKRDHWADIAGYTACGWECVAGEE